MSKNERTPDDRDFEATDTEATDAARYSVLLLEVGDVLLYDRVNNGAWIKSDVAVNAKEAR